ncbi:MAG: response regulator [Ferruginibacter sp.]
MKTGKAKFVFLADDDIDDRLLFEDALSEVSTDTELKVVADGIELMNMLYETCPPPPDVIFLDLNMPRKNGFECLDELKLNNKYKDIPIVVFSTSCEKEFINKVYEKGADHYLCKPGSFPALKAAISKVLDIDWTEQQKSPSRENFLITF